MAEYGFYRFLKLNDTLVDTQHIYRDGILKWCNRSKSKHKHDYYFVVDNISLSWYSPTEVVCIP